MLVVLVWTWAGLLQVVTVSRSSYLYQFCCAWKKPFSWSHPLPLALTIFQPPLVYRCLRLKGKGLIKTLHIELSTLLPYEHCWIVGLYCGSSIHCKKFLWWGLIGQGICGQGGGENWEGQIATKPNKNIYGTPQRIIFLTLLNAPLSHRLFLE